MKLIQQSNRNRFVLIAPVRAKKKNSKIVENNTQKNTRYLICISLRYFVIVAKPAELYSFPYLIMISQKCGSCHMNKNAENSMMLLFNTDPPAEKKPIIGGIAPTIAPGIIESTVTFFRLV